MKRGKDWLLGVSSAWQVLLASKLTDQWGATSLVFSGRVSREGGLGVARVAGGGTEVAELKGGLG